MQNWFKCCFPSRKEECVVDNIYVESKEDIEKPRVKKPSIVEPKSPEDCDKTKASSIAGNSITKPEQSRKNKPDNEISNKNKLENISQREITQGEINKAPLLLLDEDEKSQIFNGKQLKINAAGLIGGRNKRDGVCIFGIKNGSANYSALSWDFLLNYDKEVKLPYIFAIYYDVETAKYFIRSYYEEKNNKLWFIKLNNTYDVILKQSELVTMGESLFQITPLVNQGNKLEIICWNPNKTKMIFDPNKVKEVSIGRDKSCTLSYPKEKSFSKVHTTILYNESKKEWKMIDGRVNKSSTNGSWIFATHSFEVKDQMIVEIWNTKVKFSLVHGDK